jgi:hypothetical protein
VAVQVLRRNLPDAVANHGRPVLNDSMDLLAWGYSQCGLGATVAITVRGLIDAGHSQRRGA